MGEDDQAARPRCVGQVELEGQGARTAGVVNIAEAGEHGSFIPPTLIAIERFDQLQREGLVKIVPKSGTYVFTPTLADIAALCEYRAGLELQAVGLAVARNKAALHERLGSLVDRMTEAVQLAICVCQLATAMP